MHRIDSAYACFRSSRFSIPEKKAPAPSRIGRYFKRHIAGKLPLLLVFIIGVLSIIDSALAANPNTNARAQALTTSLIGLNKAYQHASPAARVGALNTLVNAAVERQALLSKLMEEDPGTVLQVALPARIRADMPEEASAFIEQRVELEGELEVLYEDYADGSHRLRHFIQVFDEHIALHFKASPPRLQSGALVRVQGVKINNQMALESSDNSILLLADGGGSSGGSNNGTVTILPNTIGEQRTIALLINFQNSMVKSPWTPEHIDSVVFGSVSDFIHENSYQQTWLAGDVRGWFDLPTDQSCSSSTINYYADQAAQNAGIDLSQYDRIIYLFPYITTCGWTGKGTVGGSPSRSYINGFPSTRSIGHELGHNFGLYHSHALECGQATTGSDCSSIEYGDSLDIMGSSGVVGHFNAFQKHNLGWLDSGSSPAITIADSNNSFTLGNYELPGTGSKAIQVPRGIDPTTGQNTWFYIEYRQPLGFDAWLSDNPNVSNGVILHQITESDRDSSYLLDITPASDTSADWDDPALVVSNQFTDAESGITISTDGTDANSATVSISFGSPVCAHHNPTISLSPTESQWVAPGTPVDFNVTVSNADSIDCGITSFVLSTLAPVGWNVQLDNDTLQLAPGTSASAIMSVTSPQTAVEGFHDIIITASESGDPSFSASATATYVIEPSEPTPTCTVQPPALSLSPVSQNGDPGATLVYTVSLADTDSTGCANSTYDLTITSLPGSWNGSISTTSMSLSPGSTGSATFSVTSPGSATAGSYSLQIAASDALETAHAQATTASYLVNDTTANDDTQPPTTPTGLTANTKTKQINLSWNASNDNVGVTGYRVWRNGVMIANITDTGYTDRDLVDNTLYEYQVEAYDAANNASGLCDPVTAGKAGAKGQGNGSGKGNGPNK